jgi:hypothetical protein
LSEFLPTNPEVRVQFPLLLDFFRNSESGTVPFSHMTTFEELFERESSGSGIEHRDYDHKGSVQLNGYKEWTA